MTPIIQRYLFKIFNVIWVFFAENRYIQKIYYMIIY